ncbi:serine/threonine-protein kinase [Streptomyces sp. Rer75]|uniref:serine/threonine-protein kinase n=1 Tax=Streptomyces sp. Rer75 TaxID=2750011 RepID=UPI0015D03BF1|nr:serine/threonine-protein kinase [Streptomyces sp. Rer75]QLH19295.1 serine/threonine protein kinase [Streptomyces sp. Rer75]
MRQIGTYAIEGVLGEGGMGIVYLGRSRGGRPVAVKVARAELSRDESFRERFRAEVAAARQVGGFHTAPVVDADTDAEPPWLATAYVPGPTLSQLLASREPMDEQTLRRLGAALAEALQAIHACGLVHRDLKPGNIIMAQDGPRVLDFGIARALEGSRLTTTGTTVGTPGFVAPEQAEGHPVNGAADVFALGAVLVAAAGGNAFGEGTPMMLMYRSVHHEPDVTAVPPALRPIVAACLAKAPQHRPTTEQLLDELAGQAERPTASYAPTALSTPATPPLPPYPPTVAALPSATLSESEEAERHEGLEFLAMDHKNAVVADDQGISLGRNGRCRDFSWDAVRGVTHAETGRGYGLTITVTLVNGTTHSCRVTTGDEDELDEWINQLGTIVKHFRPKE